MWEDGNLRTIHGRYDYQLKRHETDSEFGIDGGRIIKLSLQCEGQIVANYDRGWDMEPNSDDAYGVYQLLIAQYN